MPNVPGDNQIFGLFSVGVLEAATRAVHHEGPSTAAALMALLLPSPAVASAQPRQSRRPSHSQYCPRHLRSSVVCSFSLPGGFAPLPLLFGPRQQPRQQQVQEYTPQPLHSLDDYCEQSDAYGSLMHQAEEITFSMSPATLSMLEEAERMVEVCIQVGVGCDLGSTKTCLPVQL